MNGPNKNSHWHPGVFTPVNKAKWINTKAIIYRSGWEKKAMFYLDAHPAVLKCGSECVPIHYVNPFTKKLCRYYPDFYVESIDAKGKYQRVIYEVKPLKEANILKVKTTHDKMAIMLNYCKWKAAQKFCKDRNIQFKIITENELFV